MKSHSSISKQERRRIKAKTLLRIKAPIKKIQKIAKVSEKTVRRLQKRRTQRKPGSGRRSKLSKGNKISIKATLRHNPFLTPKDLVNRLELDCHPETVRVYLVENGFSYRLLTNKETLGEDDKESRRTRCIEMQNFQHFDDVIFTDETGYWLGDAKGKGWYPKDQTFNPMEIESQEKLNIWAAISMSGKVGIHIYEGNLDGRLVEIS